MNGEIQENSSSTPMEFTFELLQHITNHFSEEEEIGRGGYGVVYKGVLDNGEEIAVKKLHHMPWLGNKLFENELDNLKRVQHENIVRLVGHCHHTGKKLVEYNGEFVLATEEERALCFEYLQGGSLDQYISDEPCGLEWHRCYKIIKGICNGLVYLHEGSESRIYHLDLKPANILLDKYMMPKIGDFGLSRLFDSIKTYVSLSQNIKGTFGYMPPEYIDNKQISSKFDVFSLGVIIIEIMAGKESYRHKCYDIPSQDFIAHVYEHWQKRTQARMSSHTSQEVKTCIKIALKCIDTDRRKRPTISEIARELNNIDTPESSARGQVNNLAIKKVFNRQAGSEGEMMAAEFGVLLENILRKLLMVIGTLRGKPKVDAIYIKEEVHLIQATIQYHLTISRSVSRWQKDFIALRRLVDKIEDCIDLFNVKKTSLDQFAKEIDELKGTARDTRERVERYMTMANSLDTEAPTYSIQGQQVFMPAAVVPQELQALLNNQNQAGLSIYLNCLLYFSMFPQCRPISRRTLVRRWMAEGFVERENVAVQILETLSDHRIISSIQKSNNGKVKEFRPADMVHEYISDLFRSQNFMLFGDDMAQEQGVYARRLSIHSEGAGIGELDLPQDVSRVHSLTIVSTGVNVVSCKPTLDFSKLEMLRVLDLEECAELTKDHLRSICGLLLLKYLRLGDSISKVPREIENLKLLETLDMRSSEVVTVYKQVLLLPKLKHLLGKFQLSTGDSCSLPGLGLLTSEQEMFLKEKSVLETLSGFVICDSERLEFPRVMSLMRRLRKVKIWCESNASKAILDVIAGDITKFVRDGDHGPGRSLSINFAECSAPFLDTLQAPGSLGSLKLHGKLNQFPPFIAQLNGLQNLCLSSTTLRGHDILAGLSNLCTLKYLKLMEDNLGPLIIGSHYFPCLERLCLVGVQTLHSLIIKPGALCRLVSLYLLCHDLYSIPGPIGFEITRLIRLQEVALYSAVESEIKDGWQGAVMNHPNTPKLLFIEGPQLMQ